MSSNPASEKPAQELAGGAPVRGDELLPPVEPPSGGFILQLFVVPGVIVLAVVLLGLLVTTLATQGDQDPTKIVAALRSSNQTRWQKANELANMLRLEERYPELKHNAELASQLAQLLDEEVEAGLEDKNSINLRYYLCRVLGEFYVDDGVAVLLKTARVDKERDIRREAINGLAVLGHALLKLDPPKTLEHSELVETLVELANDQENLIRSQTAFALGVFALDTDVDPRLTAELELLVDDLYSDARYNAALGLARRGNLRAVDAVVEMLGADALAMNIAKEKTPALEAFKRNTLIDNALKAAQLLLEKNPHVDLVELRDALRQFVEAAPAWEPAPIPDSLIQRAEDLLAELAGA